LIISIEFLRLNFSLFAAGYSSGSSKYCYENRKLREYSDLLNYLTDPDDGARCIVASSTRRIWDYWISKKGNKTAPSGDGFQLMEVYQDAPSLQVCDVLIDGGQTSFMYRFVGTEIVQSRHQMKKPDFTGLRFEEVEYQYDFSEIHALMNKTVQSCNPVHMIRRFDAYDARGTQERLILPLVDTNGKAEKLVIHRTRLDEIVKVSRPQESSF